jgi:hypothetical protein
MDLRDALVYTGVHAFSGLGTERMRLLGQSPSPENTDFLPPWRVRLNVLCSHYY